MKHREDFTANDLLRVYEDSLNVADAAEKLGVSRKSLWRWLQALGVDTSWKNPRQPPEKRDWGKVAEWIKTYKAPLPKSCTEIAKVSGLSYKCVESYIHRRKVRFKKKVTLYVNKYIEQSTAWPDGSLITEPEFTVEVDFWTHSATVYPEGGSSFKIGATPPNGYKRKDR